MLPANYEELIRRIEEIRGRVATIESRLELDHDTGQVLDELKHDLDRGRVDEAPDRSRHRENILALVMPCSFQLDDDGIYIGVNEALAELVGQRPEDFRTKPWVSTVHPQDVGAAESAFALMRREGESHFETRGVRRDGTTFHAEVVLIRDDRRRHHGFMRDITELVRATQRTQHLEEQVRHSQRMESLGQLAGGVAHDFNNLLTAILGSSENSLQYVRHLQGGIERQALERSILQIQRAASRAATLTSQLLAFSRKQVRKLAVVDLNRIVTELEEMLRRLIGEHIELRARLAPDLHGVYADAAQIEQVIMNLVLNARDAMPTGGVLTLETANLPHAISVDAPLGRVLLAVSDTGVGMDSETMEQVFEPFFTTKPVGEGTGLGLAAVYGIATQAGATVDVKSGAGQGATFRVQFPAARDETSLTSETLVPAVKKGAPTILVCEDEPMVLDFARQTLESGGYCVLAASDGHEALGQVQAHQGSIDLLLTDIIMPQMSGTDLAQRLGERLPEMRVLFFSGYTQDIISARGAFSDRLEYLAKPFSASALLAKVQEVLA